MVAEAIPEVEVEQAQGQVPETPESIPEQEVQQEPEDNFDAVLAELVPDEEPATGEAKDVQAGADSQEASLEGLTPEQILERGKLLKEQELRQQSEATQQRNREQGLRNVLATAKSEVQQELTQAGVDTDTALRILAKYDQVHGTHLALKEADIQQSAAQVVSSMVAALQAAGAKFTGDTKFEPGASLDEYATKIAEHARKGYKSATEVKEERKQAQIALLKRLRAAGVEIPSGSLNVPSDQRASGGSKRYADMTTEERSRLTPEQRDAMVARELQRS